MVSEGVAGGGGEPETALASMLASSETDRADETCPNVQMTS